MIIWIIIDKIFEAWEHNPPHTKLTLLCIYSPVVSSGLRNTITSTHKCVKYCLMTGFNSNFFTVSQQFLI